MQDLYSADLQTWIDGLRDYDYDHRLRSAIVLGMMGAEARIAVPALILALAEEDLQFQRMILAALNEIGPADRAELPALLEALQHRHYLVRRRAAAELARLGPEAKGATQALITALADPDPLVSRWAIVALGTVRERARASAAALLTILERPAVIDRAMAVIALSRLAPDALPTLTGSLHHASPQVRRSVVRALAKSDVVPGLWVEEIRAIREDPDESVRQTVETYLTAFER